MEVDIELPHLTVVQKEPSLELPEKPRTNNKKTKKEIPTAPPQLIKKSPDDYHETDIIKYLRYAAIAAGLVIMGYAVVKLFKPLSNPLPEELVEIASDAFAQ